MKTTLLLTATAMLAVVSVLPFSAGLALDGRQCDLGTRLDPTPTASAKLQRRQYPLIHLLNSGGSIQSVMANQSSLAT